MMLYNHKLFIRMNIYKITDVNILPNKYIIKKQVINKNKQNTKTIEENEQEHYINIIPIYDCKLSDTYTKNKNYLIMLKILCINFHYTNMFKVEITKSFKFKKYIKELVNTTWGFTKKDIIKIKHIKNINNIHNYLLILKPNVYNKYTSYINSGGGNIYKWRHIYNSHKMNYDYYNSKDIFETISKIKDPTNFNIKNTKHSLSLSDIYHYYSLAV